MIALWQDSCLLGRQPPWPKGRYSALAGFVEPGESIEEATRREIWEETGVKIGAVHYHSSQPWPFPSSLMIGCVAEAESPEINIGADELEDARWFSRDEIREMVRRGIEEPDSEELALPPPLSIAFQMSNWWLNAG
jgi:NAD+ diphosphatase